MKNKRGFTLVEIIVSIALLGIISTMMIPALVGQFSLMTKTRQLTEDTAEAQQKMELEMESIRKDIRNGVVPDDRTVYTIFEGTAYERQVNGYPRYAAVSVGNHLLNLFTVVADTSLEDFPVAEAEIEIEAKDGSGSRYSSYADTPGLYVDSDVTITDPEGVHLMNLYKWYVSRPGFNIPMLNNPLDVLEIEKGTKYPSFPDDYTLILNQTGTTLTDIRESYAGRHLLCTVTPASVSGKMGVPAVSNPVFIEGLPLIDDLRLHLDASLISKEDTAAVNGTAVKRWYDLSGVGKDTYQNGVSAQPELFETKIGDFEYDDWIYETYAKYVKFDGNDCLISDTDTDLDPASKTVFAVVRNTGDSGFSIYKDDLIDPKIFTLRSRRAYVGYDGLGAYASNVEIAEVIVYSGVLSTDDSDLVLDYLRDKYQPVAPAVAIYSLQPMNDTAIRGQAYAMPATAPANMTNRTVRDVAVTWNPASINTSTLGYRYSTGTAVADNTKTTTLRVKVVDILSLQDVTDTVEQNKTYTFPSTVPASLSDGTTGYVSVAWPPGATVNTSVLGDYTFTGRATLDNSKTMTLTVRVVPVGVTSVTLNKHSLSMSSGDTETLVATVEPADAYNKNVTWSTSNSGVATVSNGVVTAIDSGTATITVTSVQGGKTDTCTVTVTNPVTGITVTPERRMVPRGGSYTLTATVSPANATNKSITWTSSNTTYATVSAGGVVTIANLSGNRPSNGTDITITATTADGGYTDTCIVTVGKPVTGITLNNTSYYIDPGSNFTLRATVTPSDAYDTDVVWSSSNTSVATVNSSGRVNGLSVGMVVITATTVDGGYTATCTVQVGRPVTGVTLGDHSRTIVDGNTYDTLVTVSPSNASDKSITWTTSNASVATVATRTSGGNTYGRITAVGPGTATITVRTNDGGFTDTCVVTVTGIPVTGVSVSPTTRTINIGSSYDLTETVSPANASDKSVTWVSSNTGVATVDSNGLVRAIGPGTAIITVRTNDGGRTASCTVTVPLVAEEIDGNGTSFTLTFNAPMGSATLSGTSCTASGYDIISTKSSGFAYNQNYSISVVAQNGYTATITVRYNRGWFLGYYYYWTIE